MTNVWPLECKDCEHWTWAGWNRRKHWDWECAEGMDTEDGDAAPHCPRFSNPTMSIGLIEACKGKAIEVEEKYRKEFEIAKNKRENCSIKEFMEDEKE